ncbi:MAG: hypothetical protein ACTHLE_22830 [Agriterribacter sp.]
MAENVANDIVYWVEIEAQHKDFLAQIRHWDNLKIAIDGASIWIKDFTDWQLRHNILHSIPFIRFYYCRDNLLFLKGSLLPNRKLTGFLWTPIERAFPITLGEFNHHFFGLHQQQFIRLVPVEAEQPATVLLIDLMAADKYITTAPAFRLQHLQWVLVNKTKALIIGDSLLPLNGKVFWQKEHFIFPVGYAMEFSILEKAVAQHIAPAGNELIWWTDEKKYSLIEKDLLQPLSIASWRQTILQYCRNEKINL